MKTIQELIDFYEAIPSERWTKGTLSSWAVGVRDQPEKNCAIGHLNKHLTGDWGYHSNEKPNSWEIVSSLGIIPISMVEANNEGPDDAKTNTINFLKEKLKEKV